MSFYEPRAAQPTAQSPFASAAATGPFAANGRAAAPAPSPPPQTPYPGGRDPYGYQQVSPMDIWRQLGYMGEPTLVDLLSDFSDRHHDTAQYMVDGGLFVQVSIMQELIDWRLTQFFNNYRLEIHQDDACMFIKPAPEQPTDEGKRLQTLTQAELQSKIDEIKAAVKANLLDTDAQFLQQHKLAATLAQQQGVMGGIIEGMTDEKGGGILNTITSTAVGGLRMAAGLPAAPRPPGA
jgi:hypothetical protein